MNNVLHTQFQEQVAWQAVTQGAKSLKVTVI